MRSRKDPRTPRARELRREATPFERRLWLHLRQLPVEGSFRRQAPIGPYFADFANHALRIVVELDGDQHGLPEGRRHDLIRDAFLTQAGYRVLRFWNNELAHNLDGVVETIFRACADQAP